MIRRSRRKPCDHAPLLAEIEALKIENAKLTVRLVTYEALHWMHGAIVRRDRMAKAEQQRTRRMQNVAEEPTAIYSTEAIRRAK